MRDCGSFAVASVMLRLGLLTRLSERHFPFAVPKLVTKHSKFIVSVGLQVDANEPFCETLSHFSFLTDIKKLHKTEFYVDGQNFLIFSRRRLCMLVAPKRQANDHPNAYVLFWSCVCVFGVLHCFESDGPVGDNRP